MCSHAHKIGTHSACCRCRPRAPPPALTHFLHPSTSLADHHRLASRWAFWYLKKVKPARGASTNWHEGLTLAGRFNTVEGFWRLYSHIVRPDSIDGSVDLMLFRDGIQVR